MSFSRFRVGLIFLGLAASTSQAHDFWIEANRYFPEAGADVALTWRVGVGFKGDTLPYITEWIDDFSVVTAAARRPIRSIVGSDPAAKVESEGAAFLVGYQGERSFVELKPEKFNEYLRDEGMEYILNQREERDEANESAPEYFVRCAKSLVAGKGRTPRDVYGATLDYELELIPQGDPYALVPGDSLEFVLLFRGEPIEGLLVQAVSRANPESRSASRTDSDGRATLFFADPSLFLVKAVHMIPVENDNRARWESFWASFTFEMQK